VSHPYVKDGDFTQWDRCQCTQPPCSPLHDRLLPHQLAATAGSLLDPNKLMVMCRCGESAEYDMQWGMMLVPSVMWRRVERQLQDESGSVRT
jgi:hypothetical protein